MSKKVSGRDDPRFRQIDSVDDYLGTDIARTHGFTRSDGTAGIDPQLLDEQHEKLLRDGYVIIENLVPQAALDALREQTRSLLDQVGRNSFEGERTQRIYAVPEKIRAGDPFIEQPLILAHLDRLFQPNYLLSQAQVINVMSDSPAQPLHVDDGFYPWPRPRPPLSAATVFAVDDFTFDNGATLAVPGSHLWDEDRRVGPEDEVIAAAMPAGSCILFLGTLWHGAGENRSDSDRLAITAQYCEPWLRTQENFFLSVSPETVAKVSENIRRMLGYSIHPPFMGMADGMHPKRTLPLPG
jgi:ectoine hydroxylase-related dioxygenase (phytanoyl-CoA dioxygenase family)